MSNITLRDIANSLGLSVSTVSKALRDSYEISDATKRRVVDYAQAHHYFPNRIAKSLKDGKSGSIGVVVCSIDNSFVSCMLDGIDQICAASGYDIIIMQSKESLHQEKACIKQLEARGVEGLLISPSAETQDTRHIDQLAAAGMPIVFFDRTSDRNDVFQVGIDNRKSGFLATQHLIDNGYRHIAMLNIGPGIYFADQRGDGYRDALNANGIDYRKDYVQRCVPFDRDRFKDGVEKAIATLLSLPDPPEALFTTTDQLSSHALRALHQLGRRIPEDMALIGFSNTEFAGILTPPLSVVYQPALEIGRHAAETMVRLLAGKEGDSQGKVFLPVRMDVRESSRPRG